MTAASNSEARKRASEAASNSKSATGDAHGPNRGAGTSETEIGRENANLRSVLTEALRPFVQCGDRYCGTIPSGNARCEDCRDLVATATDLVVGIVERRPQPIPAPVDSGAIGQLSEAETNALADKWLAASEAARKLEHHWPADCLAEAAEIIRCQDALVREHTDRALAEVEEIVYNSEPLDHSAGCDSHYGEYPCDCLLSLLYAALRAARQEQ